MTKLRPSGDPAGALAFVRALGEAIGIPARALVLEGDQVLHGGWFVHGDLEVRGNLEIIGHLGVTGDLVVRGLIEDNGPESYVLIRGDVRCRALYTHGDFAVLRDIHAAELVLGYYNDNVLTAGRIIAPVVIEDEHAVDAHVEARHHFALETYRQGHGDGVAAQIRALFVPEVIDDERLDNQRVVARLRASQPIFQTG